MTHTSVAAYAAPAPKAPLERTTIPRRELGAHDILIDIKFAGICHSDIHTARAEWGEGGHFPLVPGHEIAGVVAATGSAVSRYAVGDRVGVGCFVDSCRECDNCRAGIEQYCTGELGNVGTYNAVGRDGEPTQGGYSTHLVVDENYALRIPESIPLDAAAPLLCAGITVYSPLAHWQAGPGKKVAVVGLGGLGHMGVKIAHAMGAEVTVLSQSLRKKDDGLRFGADAYHATSDPATFEALAGTFDLIINTVSADLDLNAYLSLLRTDGTLVQLGAPEKPLTVAPFALIGGRRSFAGSLIGGIRETQEMLDFCGEHSIAADIELISADRINEAYERVLASDVRYRFVIDTSTI
ncbi:NAD(P)-dependent alcohol dehydrogenase [Streptomyces sp. NBC_01525]|uniref:alcohol dehydrogenase (NADP(+)) n=1 Tax=Streptomyces benahoarensis TaxID=2595054 RepID=A0A553YZJ3_9ACTN|nr:NAD(P)-dependent alcohol dehydrogenase [Streptomyces benahoarensis]TSB17623.1 NAD(P)-dependent alcohol dehydrogenase [Streptomyces benahoarensis]TSB34599.1 NAD(P)-dependent alcohol dehydrogenase [Streptomyces benahoarensis]